MRSDGRKHLLRWHFLKPAKNLGRGEHLFTLVSELGHRGVRQSRPRAGPPGRPWQPGPSAGTAAGLGCSACSPPGVCRLQKHLECTDDGPGLSQSERRQRTAEPCISCVPQTRVAWTESRGEGTERGTLFSALPIAPVPSPWFSSGQRSPLTISPETRVWRSACESSRNAYLADSCNIHLINYLPWSGPIRGAVSGSNSKCSTRLAAQDASS